MRSPFLIARFVLFSLIIYLNVLALGFAAWEISSMRSAGLPVAGSPVFVIFNTCALFLCMVLAGAELVFPKARTAQINFECGWSAAMSSLQLASAIDATVNGAPVYCGTQSYGIICAASTVLSALTWTSSLLVLAYFLTLFYLAVSHVHVYGGIWRSTVYQAPWFVERPIPYAVTKLSPKAGNEPYENPAFSAHEDEDNTGDHALMAARYAPFTGHLSDVDIERLSVPSTHFRAAPSPARSQESLRPQWAKRFNTRRGVDAPFATLPVAQRVPRLIKSFWSASSLPPSPPPKPNLPQPANLNGGFLDCHRASYGFFPEEVEDADKPIRQPRMSQWVQARQ